MASRKPLVVTAAGGTQELSAADTLLVAGNSQVVGTETVDTLQANTAATAGTNTAGGTVSVNGQATSGRFLRWLTAGVLRWQMGMSGEAEAGSNAGSNLAVYNYTDAGAYIGSPVVINRATGAVTLGSLLTAGAGLTVNGGPLVVNYNLGGVPAGVTQAGSCTYGWNLSAGGGDVSEINNYYPATASFLWHQRTGAAAVTQLMRLNPDGSLYLGAGAAQVATQSWVSGSYATTASPTFSGTLTAGVVTLTASTGLLSWSAGGVAPPAFTTRSAGTKIVLYPALSGTSGDYALGIDTSTMWLSVQDASASFKFYAGTTVVATIDGSGNLTAKSVTTTGGELVAGWNGSGFIGQVRLTYGTGPSAILRNDGSSMYLLDAGNATGSFSAHRPFAWNLTTGAVAIAGDGSSTAIGGDTSVAGNLTGNLSVTAGTNTAAGPVSVNGPSGVARLFRLLTAGVLRWQIGANQTAESGSNVGSDFGIYRYTDAGAFIDAPISIARSTGVVTFTAGISGTGATFSSGLSALQLTAAQATSTSIISNVTNGAADAKQSDILNTTTGTNFRFVNDAFSAANAWLSAVRSGYAITSVTVTAPTINLTGAVVVSGAMTLSSTAQFANGNWLNWLAADGTTVVNLLRLSSANNTIIGGTAAGGVYIAPTGGLQPATTGNTPLGSTGNRWSALYTGTGDFSGAVTMSTTLNVTGVCTFGDAVTSGTNSVAGSYVCNGFAGSNRLNVFNTAGSARWKFGANSTAEAGSNAGSDYILNRYDDTGVSLGTAFQITRSNGALTHTGSSFTSTATSYQLTTAAQLVIGSANTGTTTSIEFGSQTTVNTTYLDWHSSGTSADYDFRMQATGGSATAGQGTMAFSGAAFTWNGSAVATASSVGANTKDYVVSGFQSGIGTASLRVLGHVLPHAITLPASLAGSMATAFVAATASTVFTLAYVRSGSSTSIATITFAAAGTTGTFGSVVIPTLAAGDILVITGPAGVDATLADVCFSILGAKQ